MPKPPEAKIFRLIGLVPVGIGLLVLTAVWTPDLIGDKEFSSLPVFFRLFISLIACMFLGVGSSFLFLGTTVPNTGNKSNAAEELASKIKDLENSILQLSKRDQDPDSALGTNYNCPSCSAPLSIKSDVSPLGDVKCRQCGTWYNIFGRLG